MPGDLRDPESSPWPYHHDNRYDGGADTHLGPVDLKYIIQSTARSELGHPLSREGVMEAIRYLESEKLDYLSPGDQKVQEAIKNYIQIINKKRKVATKWLTLI